MKNFSLPKIEFALLLISAFSGSTVLAAVEDAHSLAASAGIALPSSATGVFENPAGLAFNSRFRLTVQGQFDSPTVLKGGILGGNGSVGGALGISKATDKNGQTDGFVGLGVRVPSNLIALGVAAFAPLSSAVSDPSFNVGALIGVGNALTLGLLARSIDKGVDEWGAGLKYQASPATYLVLDSAVDSDFNYIAVQPGILIGSNRASLTLSYGFEADGKSGHGSGQLHEGFSAGAGFKLGSSASCQFYYQHLAELYAAVSFTL
ncbi:MAG TPA: hypothetical protein DCS07_12170 [Bdellovibrionales bacterium]|nr:MAG: hypothetical protein A2Z97_02055 [Bdellovibrionales bacterium GWB1_52_6]OFZ03762.1 MAG: hypothetical protein A2X97_14515 [Bdellovibrionales bacterium GWA1_52_35]OFZ41783.1 MAG: hypothetical protein A2070_09285 [Bdellovibrionales bacterium GWC1_52_8]HAR43365.1 hypothetical protein [Bdellovibrionales bacterium]HCM38721.1 hypothetical protein [Bdellovibrionales bacterium]